MHKFDECHAFSLSHEDFWEGVYKRFFPEYLGMHRYRDKATQGLGMDREVLIKGGRSLIIEEKLRRSDYGDVLLEYESNSRRGTPGWIEKRLAIDFLAYGFLDSRRCLLFPWALLRRAWIMYGAEWVAKGKARRDGFRNVVSDSGAYQSRNVAVPMAALDRVCRPTIVSLSDRSPPTAKSWVQEKLL